MPNLFDVMLNAASLTGELRHGSMKSFVTATSFVDNGRVESQDAFIGGTLFIPKNNSTHLVTAFDQTADKVTYSPAASPTPSANDGYMITAIDRDSLVDIINNALLIMGRYVTKTEVTADVKAGNDSNVIQLPSTISDIIDIEEYVGGSQYNLLTNWDEVQDEDGLYTYVYAKYSGYTVAIPGSTEDKVYRITYMKPHPRVYKDDDIIMTPYHAARVAMEAAYAYYFQRMAIKGNADDKETMMFQTLQLNIAQLRAAYPVRHKQKAYKVARF